MPKLEIRSQRNFARGMNDTAEIDEYRFDEIASLFNARVSYDGDAGQRRKGSQRTHTTALNSGAQIYGAKEFYDASGVRFLVVIAGSEAFTSTDDGVTWVSRQTGLTGAGWDFTIMQSGANRLLIMVNGSGAPQTWNGTTWADLTGTSIPQNAKLCEYHNNRVWMWGHSNDLLVGSIVDDPTDFSSANGGVTVRIEILQGDPEPRGLWSQGPSLLAMTWEQVGYVEGWGLNTLQVLTGHRGLSRSLGCVGHRTLAQAGEAGVIWLSKLGFVYMEQGAQPVLISNQIQRFIDGLSWDNIRGDRNLPTAAWYERLHEYHCAVPALGNSQNTHVVVIRPRRAGRPTAIWINRPQVTSGSALQITDGVLELAGGGDREFVIQGGVLNLLPAGEPGLSAGIVAGVLETVTNDTVASALFGADDDAENVTGELWSGSYDGFVRRLEIGNLDDVLSDDSGGQDITAVLRTRPESFGDQFRNARTRSSRIGLKAPTGGSIDVYPVADGALGTKQTHTVKVQQTVQTIRARVSAKGYALQTEVQFTDDITIQGIEIAAEILRESP